MTRNGWGTATIITTSSIVHKFIRIFIFSHLSSSLYLPSIFFPGMCVCNLEKERVMQHFSHLSQDTLLQLSKIPNRIDTIIGEERTSMHISDVPLIHPTEKLDPL